MFEVRRLQVGPAANLHETSMEPRATSHPPSALRPRDDEIDLFGLTHQGHRRASNQDHFLIATIHAEIKVNGTSLTDTSELPLLGNRLGTVLLVADGVGGTDEGGAASKLATESVIQYVASSLRCYHEMGIGNDPRFLTGLREAAIRAHDAVVAEAATRADHPSLATTLTLGIGVWPWLYVVQVGDSRAYIYSGRRLVQVTRDQTMAQEMLDIGALTPADLPRSPLKDILSSAIGAEQATPEVSRVDVSERGCVLVFCTDGLTKHVTDAEIESHCARGLSAEQLARSLVDLALDRGGSDNVTVVVAQAPVKARGGATT
jgi:serine/threonine protein phosphatase PrpC